MTTYTFDNSETFPYHFFEDSEEPVKIVTPPKYKVRFISPKNDGEDPYYISQIICVTEGQITIFTFSYPNKKYKDRKIIRSSVDNG